MSRVWVIFSPLGKDDYGAEMEPAIMAICSSYDIASAIRADLWGGQPGDTYIDEIELDKVLE